MVSVQASLTASAEQFGSAISAEPLFDETEELTADDIVDDRLSPAAASSVDAAAISNQSSTFAPSGVSGPVSTVAEGSQHDGGIDGKALWRLSTQGVPSAAAAVGDYARAEAISGALVAAGTYTDEPLHTQDTGNVMSIPMRFLVGDHMGHALSPSERVQIDIESAGYSNVYMGGKLARYLLAIGGNIAATAAFARDTRLSEDERTKLHLRNYYDLLGNVAFTADKVCSGATLLAIGAAQLFGRGTTMWEAGYIAGTIAVNGAFALSILGWWAKAKSGLSMLEAEQQKYVSAVEKGEDRQINTPDVNAALFSLGNAIARVPKFAVAIASSAILGAALFAPERFSFLRENSAYVSDAMEKLQPTAHNAAALSTNAEALYRWANYAFVVPKTLVIGGLLLALLPPSIGFGVIAGKTIRNLKEHWGLRGLDPNGTVEVKNGKTHRMTVAERTRQLSTEHIVNALGIGAAASLIGTAVSVYPATEPHALLFTSTYGGLLFLQYMVKEGPAIRRFLAGRNMGQIWQAIRSTRKKRAESKDSRGFMGKLWESIKIGHAIAKNTRAAEEMETEGLNVAERIVRQWNLFANSLVSWGMFFKAFFMANRMKKMLPDMERGLSAAK